MNDYLIRSIEFLYVLIVLTDDLPGCKVVDCTKILAEEICPKTCSEQRICQVADCTKPESSKFCPKTCAEISKTDMCKNNKRKYIVCFPWSKIQSL